MHVATLQLVTAFLLAIPIASARAQAWQQYATPEEAGFSAEALDRTRRLADSLLSGGTFVVYRGKVLVAWGDVSRKLQLHSVRKSLTSTLYGVAVAERKIDLAETLASLQVDDTNHLTPAERRATVKDLISARSGVYLPAAYAPADQDSTRPARGSHAPGTNWFYNNWDFNVAELIYEKRTGTSVYEAFQQKIAAPIGMEDYRPTDGFLVYEPSLSIVPAHTWRVSARDLARLGQLFLQRGLWNGKQIVSPSWITESTTPHSDLGGGRGYGYMWWTYAPNSYGSRYPALNKFASFAASGTGGQAIIVVPEAELVVVQRGDTDHDRNFSRGWALVDAVLAAKQGDAKPSRRFVPLSPVPLASQLPPIVMPATTPTPAAELNALIGEYDMGAPIRARVFAYMGKPFAFLPGRGEAELLRVRDWEYTIAVVAGVNAVAERDAAGLVAGITLRLGNQTIRMRRVR